MIAGTLSGVQLPKATYPYSDSETLATLGFGKFPSASILGDVPDGWTTAVVSAEPWSMADEFASDDIVWLREADARFISPLLRGIAVLYTDALLSKRRTTALAAYASAALVLLIALVYVGVVYFPRIKTLHRQRHRVQTLLLFLPPPLLSADGPSRELSAIVECILCAGRT